MKSKYSMLLKVLDRLNLEAPASYKTYHPDDSDVAGLDKARSLSFIHLFLKVKFGITDFLDRHKLITDGTQDGGLDAYFIDHEQKKLYLIQAKFRNNSQNFDSKSMSTDDLIKMEVSNLIKGVKEDSNGVQFNAKILAFQSELQRIRDIARYDYQVILLGNLYKLNDSQIRKLIDNAEYQIFDSEKTYNELLFPLATSTHYDPNEIIIKLLLSNKEHPRLKQLIETEYGNYNVTVVFVPIIEIAKVMSQYKNSILKYNPRNYLQLQKKSVNEKIKSTIIDQDKNSFALLNNGITLISENLNFSDSTGKQNEGQIILTKPQILNGGQTAFTISKIYEESLGKSKNPLIGKEVLLKVITPIESENKIDPNFIELISNATNQQNEVSEGDRRSNHPIQIELQSRIFETFGYFYERKKGEFQEGYQSKFIDGQFIINRFDFLKAYWAYKGEPAAARRTSEENIFQEDIFYRILSDTNSFKEMFFSYLLFEKLINEEKKYQKKSDSISEVGYGLIYGKWAVIASIGILKLQIPIELEDIVKLVELHTVHRLRNWKDFDEFISKKRKGTKYFPKTGSPNYELFYKINFLDEDIREYFLK
ncbi:AIPR family protein [Leptospira sp. 201903071]|uniref:AIPR family protein n=1 Tax=Leptospira ainazelensis TaxID=2810034 RepID=UPI001962990D|nr:AIPR family protein [Leptospira ainazelensis]MBM9499221.1 AIPR family protein [Leptospira ainazelensis]